MTGKKIRHKLEPDERKRNIILEKRLDGLLKMAKELSVLCGVESGVAVMDAEGNNPKELWPSPEQFEQIVQKFSEFPDAKKTRKMVQQCEYLEERLKDEEDDALKIQMKNNSKELKLLMNQVMRDKNIVSILDLHQLTSLSSYTTELLMKLEKRSEALASKEQEVARAEELSLTHPSHAGSSSEATAQPDLGREYSWLTDNVVIEKDVAEYFGLIPPTSGGGGGD